MKWKMPMPRSHRETAHAEAILRERLNAGAIDEPNSNAGAMNVFDVKRADPR